MTRPALAQATFSTLTQGGLAHPTGNFYQLETAEPSTFQVPIDTGYVGTLQLATPTLVLGPSTDPDETKRTATATSNSTSVNSGGSAVDFPTGTTTLDVSMAVECPTIYPSGTYSYQVVVTVTAAPD